MKNQITKNRKLLDAETSIWEVFQHSVVNFLLGFTSSLVILSLSSGVGWLVFAVYYTHKQFESKVINRSKYTSNLGKYVIFPLPSSLGFLFGWYISKTYF